MHQSAIQDADRGDPEGQKTKNPHIQHGSRITRSAGLAGRPVKEEGSPGEFRRALCLSDRDQFSDAVSNFSASLKARSFIMRPLPNQIDFSGSLSRVV